MRLLDKIFREIEDLEEGMSGEDAVEKAVQRALDSTTVERPGCPWGERDGS